MGGGVLAVGEIKVVLDGDSFLSLEGQALKAHIRAAFKL